MLSTFYNCLLVTESWSGLIQIPPPPHPQNQVPKSSSSSPVKKSSSHWLTWLLKGVSSRAFRWAARVWRTISALSNMSRAPTVRTSAFSRVSDLWHVSPSTAVNTTTTFWNNGSASVNMGPLRPYSDPTHQPLSGISVMCQACYRLQKQPPQCSEEFWQ